jgi:hypothetical protein
VLDSSRYFVLRIEHQGRHAFVGIGFNERFTFVVCIFVVVLKTLRNHAFDFNVAVTDHKRDLEREAEVVKIKQAAAMEPQIDFSFKEGEKITINVQAKSADGQEAKRSGRRAAQPSSGGGGFLPPPPAAKTSIRYICAELFFCVFSSCCLLFSGKRAVGGMVAPPPVYQQQYQQPPQNNNNNNNNGPLFGFQQQQLPPQQQFQPQPPQGGSNNNWFA